MSKPRSIERLLGILLAAAGLVVACGSSGGFEDDTPSFTPDAGPDATDAPPSGCGFRCSADLKKVLHGCDDQVPSVVAACGPDEGCGVDGCVPACESAAISKGSAGCAFWTLPPDDPDYSAGACFAAMIANTWDRPVTIQAEFGNAPLDISRSIYTATTSGSVATYTPVQGPLPPGQVAIVFLAQNANLSDDSGPRCPEGVVPAVDVDPIRHLTTKTRAFHLTTDAPVAAYSIFPYGGASSEIPSATLLLPVSSWDTSYVAVATGKFGDASRANLDRRTLQIVADDDGTEVSMLPVNDIESGNDVTPGIAGKPVTWSLQKGEVLQITQNRTTSGSPLASNKPIAVFGGSPCSFLPADVGYCDLTQQQIAPFSQWGTRYALVPYPSRIDAVTGNPRESVPYSVVGAVDGTVLTYDPVRPPGAPERLQAGQMVTFLTDALVTVASQDSKHPFHAAVYMTGAQFGGGGQSRSKTTGDPDFVNLAPTDQFLQRYVFFTDYTFPDTSLTIVRRKVAGSFAPVRLGCAGEITDFQPLGQSGDFEFAWVALTRSFHAQAFAGGSCGYGRQEAESDGPFSVTVWGTGKDASYGYVAGIGSRPVNDAPPPVVR